MRVRVRVRKRHAAHGKLQGFSSATNERFTTCPSFFLRVGSYKRKKESYKDGGGRRQGTRKTKKDMNEKRTIERLDQLTLQEFVDIACGDLSLINGDESLAARLVMQYKKVSDPSDFRRSITDRAVIMKCRGSILFYALLRMLLEMGEEKEVRALLLDLGKRKVSEYPLDRMRMSVDSLYEHARVELKRAEDTMEKEVGTVTPDEMRQTFFSETATIMKVLKVSIDVSTINALVYANLRHQADEHIKETLRQFNQFKNR